MIALQATDEQAPGPLADLRVIELAGMGPAPFACMILSDLGAKVLRIVRPGSPDPKPTEFDARGRESIALDLKTARDVRLLRQLTSRSEVFIEGFRPGVTERLGFGPDVLLSDNPRLVYGRMTGWGQSGPLAMVAGHDINYLALTGALHSIGTEDKPVVPLNLAADYGGGGMFLLVGVLSALMHARATGTGQVVDAAMIDGASAMMSMFYGMNAAGEWHNRRRANVYDGGAPFYDTYRCADGNWIAIGALEPAFFNRLLRLINADPMFANSQYDRGTWSDMRSCFETIFVKHPRDHWCDLLGHEDVCFAPVLNMDEAPFHAHNVARGTFIRRTGIIQPAPAPRFSVTPARAGDAPQATARDVDAIIADWQSTARF